MFNKILDALTQDSSILKNADFTKCQGKELFCRYVGNHFPCERITSVSSDPIQKLLAFGFNDGKIFVGRNEFCILEHEESVHPIVRLVFEEGHGRIAAINNQNTIYIWNLNHENIKTRTIVKSDYQKSIAQKGILHIISNQSNILEAAIPNLSKWLFVSFKDSIRLLNVQNGIWSSASFQYYNESDILIQMFNPSDPSLLLFVHANGFIGILDIRKSKLHCSTIVDKRAQVACWHPSGDYIALGCEDGEIIIYKSSSLKVYAKITAEERMSAFKGETVIEFSNMKWAKSTMNTTIIIISGGCSKDFDKGIQILQFQKDNFKDITQLQYIDVSFKIIMLKC
ncbi:WD40 repeat-like protein [Rozella allomycis CSF55]|uniref:WD40 repeat-like protein n=1 Tax=Rozella allomycis (strain CSF55) TaxID=988480 RepID=A0A4P9YLU0_ROZAC|nr:WD40 repeat-like protein [Rozella allomycis CSF55]